MAANHLRRYGATIDRRAYKPIAEINVTPFVDVMLVLLVVFMITAPLLTIGVPVDLPETSAGALQGSEQPLAITLDREGRIYLQETEVALDELVPRLTAIARARGGDVGRIFIRADRKIEYGAVMSVMGLLNAGGFKRLAFPGQHLRAKISPGSKE